MSSVALFADQAKEIKDAFTDDFDTKCVVKNKFASTQGFSITTEVEIHHDKKESDDGCCQLGGSINFKGKKDRIKIEKLKLKEKGEHDIDVSFEAVDHTRVTIKSAEYHSAGTFYVGGEYRDNKVAATLEADTSGANIRGSVVGEYEGVSAGGCLSFDVRERNVDCYGLLLGYKNSKVVSALRACAKLTKFSVVGGYHVNDKLFGVVEGCYDASPSNSCGSSGTGKCGDDKCPFGGRIGGVYHCNDKTTIRAKIGSCGSVGFSVLWSVLDNLALRYAVDVNAAKIGEFKHGAGLLLG